MKKIPALSIIVLIISFSANSQDRELVAEGAQLQLLSDGFEFTEGPAADAEGNVFFTDQPNNRIHKWSAEDYSISVFMNDAGRANGLHFDKEGNLYAAADDHSEIWKIDRKKNVSVVLEGFRGKRFNGPNDLWISPDGAIYFTDPFYKRPYWKHEEQPINRQRVYYLSADRKEFSIADEDLIKPNGIIGTADGKALYVADIEDDKTWKYDIADDGSLRNKTLFTNLGSDGMTIDEQGNLYLTGDGVTIFDLQGEKIQHIPVDKEWTANVTFGGKDNNILFVTAMDSIYGLEMNVKGQGQQPLPE